MTPAVRFTKKQTPFIVRAALRGDAAREQMADDFRVLNANAGSVTADDLELLGWERSQIETLGPAARRHALKLAAEAA